MGIKSIMGNYFLGEENYGMKLKYKAIKKEGERLRKLEEETTPNNTLNETVQHFSHPHPIMYLEPDYAMFNCNSCSRKGHGKRYHCTQCEFDLHPICAKSNNITWLVHHMTPEEMDTNGVRYENVINSFAHPSHELVAKYKRELFKCNHCNDSGNGVRLSCDVCDVVLHQVCAQNPTKLASYMHPQHELALILSPCFVTCDLCGLSGTRNSRENFIYGCKGCDFYLHSACTQWPLHLAHPLHPPHPLALKPRDKYAHPDDCSACKQAISGKYNLYKYSCKLCGLDFHLNCILEHSKQGIGEDVKKNYDAQSIDVLPVTNLNLPKITRRHTNDFLLLGSGRRRGFSFDEVTDLFSTDFSD